MAEKGTIYTVKITDISSDGSGVGNIDGQVIFVPFTAIGDVIEAEVVKVKSSYAIGKLINIIEMSGDRVNPGCVIYKECGGCHLQHIDYDEQINIKKNFIESAMGRIGGFDGIECDEMLRMDSPYRYRNKCIFSIGRGKSGEPVSGFFARGTHDIVESSDCIVSNEISAKINKAVVEYMKECNAEPYDESTHLGLIRRVFIRNARETGEIMTVIAVNGNNIPKREKLIKRLKAVSEKIVSIYININKDRGSMLLGRENKLVYGKESISDKLCGTWFEISPNSFYQINPYMTEKLYNKALEYAQIRDKDKVLDVYCGIGTISLAAAKSAKSVTGIEIVKQAIADAKKNAANNGINNVRFYAESAEKAVPRLIRSGLSPDIVIIDPPRKGSDQKTLQAIVSAEPKRIVYVSCNPATLARDAKYLAENGYTPEKLCGVDMFPHTCHVETVCQLVLRRSPVHINIDVDVEELVQDKRGQATYEQIKAYVMEHSGLKVSSLYIAQIKRKCGIIERENYNKPKSKDMKQLICPPEKEAAIKDALTHFGMI